MARLNGCLWGAALNEALREEVQRLKVATGQVSSGSGQSLSMGGQHVFQMQSQSFNPQQLQQAQPASNNAAASAAQQQQGAQQQMHSDYLQRGAYNVSSGFMKSEEASMAVSHASSASFG